MIFGLRLRRRIVSVLMCFSWFSITFPHTHMNKCTPSIDSHDNFNQSKVHTCDFQDGVIRIVIFTKLLIKFTPWVTLMIYISIIIENMSKWTCAIDSHDGFDQWNTRTTFTNELITDLPQGICWNRRKPSETVRNRPDIIKYSCVKVIRMFDWSKSSYKSIVRVHSLIFLTISEI